MRNPLAGPAYGPVQDSSAGGPKGEGRGCGAGYVRGDVCSDESAFGVMVPEREEEALCPFCFGGGTAEDLPF